MSTQEPLDCLVIGYNDPPFESYEELLRQYGEDSEAYRDLKFSFVDLDGEKLSYVELLNHVLRRGQGGELALASGDIPNLAAAYLTNFLRRRKLRADYLNLFQLEKDRFAEILARRPRCVAITTTFYVLNFPVTEMVEFVRRHDPEAKIVIGGPLVSNHARNYHGEELQAALMDIGADVYVQESQGELALARLVESLRSGGDFHHLPNIFYRSNGGYVATPREPEDNCLDENYIDWLSVVPAGLGTTLQTRTARSCAFSCAFCNYPTRAGKLRLASLETIERELDSMHARGDVKNVVFIDDTFNVPLPRFKDICRLFIRKDYGFKWFSYFRCSNSDEEAVELMARSGCAGVFLGIESGSPSILRNMSKRATVEKYLDGIELLRSNGILTFGSFILGFPGETEETVRETRDFIERSGVDYYRIQMWYNEPGTPIRQQEEQFGIEGDGFVWSHDSMDSQEAMDHIERLFLGIQKSEWLPQWSFDFWIIPYLLGKGITLDYFKQFMHLSNQMLKLEIAALSPQEKARLQQDYLGELIRSVERWELPRRPAGVL